MRSHSHCVEVTRALDLRPHEYPRLPDATAAQAGTLLDTARQRFHRLELDRGVGAMNRSVA